MSRFFEGSQQFTTCQVVGVVQIGLIGKFLVAMLPDYTYMYCRGSTAHSSDAIYQWAFFTYCNAETFVEK